MLENFPVWAWLIVVVGGPVILGVALAYGVRRSHRRSEMQRIHTTDRQSPTKA
jgi:hypothetical protein